MAAANSHAYYGRLRTADTSGQRMMLGISTMSVLIDVSWGELLDKISILEIKSERITDADALANVRHELALLTSARDQSMPSDVDISAEFSELREINKELWDIEDDIRDCERRSDFGSRFVELARAVYGTNDKRSAIKRRLNESLGSTLIEEKSYTTYS